MIRFYTARRALALLAIVLASGFTLLAERVWVAALYDSSVPSGWMLFGIIGFLALYSGRKLFPFLPMLGSSALWLQIHVYVGVFSALLLGVHVGFRWPRGVFEIVLFGVYLAVFTSGLAGLFLSRYLARRLTTRGAEVLYERIPILRRRLLEAANTIVAESATRHEATPLADFHLRVLVPFFSGPRGFWSHLVSSHRGRREVLGGLDSIRIYIHEDLHQTVHQLCEYVRQKDDLDYHYALQTVLKRWLFVHVPLTYCLLISGLLHGFVAQAYSGGWLE